MIHICIPAHNEARTAGVVLWKIRGVMAEFGRDYRILLLDDASTDDTREVVAPYARLLPLEILKSEKRRGHGASLEALIRSVVASCEYPRRDVIVTLQADFTDDPTAIPPMVKRIEGGADLVVSAQPVNGKSVPRAVRWVRRGLPWLERKFDFPNEISDPLSGLRAYRVGLLKRALQDVDENPLVTKDGWAASVELLLAVAPHTDRIVEVESEVRYDRRKRSTRLTLLRIARDYMSFLKDR